VVHGADDLAAIYESKIKERDEYLEYAYGSGYKDDRFYSHMPKLEDGKYVSDPLDEDERRRREEVRASYLKEDQPSAPLSDEKKSELTAPTPVPMNATLGGSGGGDAGSSSAPLPPPVNLPPPPPAMDGGDFVPPEPPPVMDEPPPPPVVD
jgi:general secretion pathway protein D